VRFGNGATFTFSVWSALMKRCTSPDVFLDLVRKSKLVEEQHLTDTVKQAPGPFAAAQDTARHLIKTGLITSFQAQQLLVGRYKGFFLRDGQFKVLQPLGRGGMGTVYLCEHLQLSRRVAIKVLAREHARDRSTLERFQREARAAAALDHPNIVRVHDVSVSEDLALLVMEYVEGTNLQEVVKREGPIPHCKAVGYAQQAAAGLLHAHERGIIHRDVKPANLLLGPCGTIKVLDMGLARFLHKEESLTQKLGMDSVLGTADFMSPEQAIAGKSIDARTDVYSLGVTLYTLICGRTPFDGSTTQKLLAHQLRDPVPAHEVQPRVPAALSAILDRMMAKNRDQRYATVAEVLVALAPFSDAPMALPAGTQLPRRPRAHRSRRLLVAAAALVLLVAGVLGAGWSLGWGRARPQNDQAAVVPANPSPPPATEESKPPPAQPSRPASPAVVAQPTEKELYRLDLMMQGPFLSRIEKRELSGAPAFPDSWSGHCWKEESVAEVLAQRVAGSMALGFRNLEGEATCQLCTNLSGALGGLEQGRRYVLRVQYQGEKEANGAVYVRKGDFSHIAFAQLKSTSGRWEVVEVPFDQEADQAKDLAFCTTVSGPDTTLFIRSVVLVEQPSSKATR
jgi:serine/threonine protein kinase